MKNQTKKPEFNSYKRVMIPHLLPLEAKRRGIKPKDKLSWKGLAKAIRAEVKNRYETATPDELWSDMQFKRSSGSKSRIYFKHTIEVYEDCAYPRKADVINSYLQSNEIIESLRYINPSTRDWIDNRRHEKLGHISKYEKTFVKILERANIKSILKMPFVVDNRIYFSDVYIPKFKLAIEVVRFDDCRDNEKDVYKAEDLNSIGITHIILYNHEASHPDIAMKIMKNYK